MSDDKDNVFINRHGKKMTLDGTPVDLPVIDEPVASLPSQTTIKPKKVKKVRNKKPIKKVLAIILIFLGVLVLIPVVTGELVRARYAASHDGARKELLEFAAETVVPQQKKQMKLVQLSEAANKVEQIRDDACEGGLLDNMATLYPRAKAAHGQCIALKQKIAAIALGLRDMENQVRYLEALAPALEPVAKGTTEEFAIISAQHENWRALTEALAKLSPAASQRAAHEQLKLQSQAIVDAWSALNTANNSQDAAAFAAAEKKLGEAYEAFRSSSSALAKVMNDTQTNLTASYKTL